MGIISNGKENIFTNSLVIKNLIKISIRHSKSQIFFGKAHKYGVTLGHKILSKPESICFWRRQINLNSSLFSEIVKILLGQPSKIRKKIIKRYNKISILWLHLLITAIILKEVKIIGSVIKPKQHLKLFFSSVSRKSTTNYNFQWRIMDYFEQKFIEKKSEKEKLKL